MGMEDEARQADQAEGARRSRIEAMKQQWYRNLDAFVDLCVENFVPAAERRDLPRDADGGWTVEVFIHDDSSDYSYTGYRRPVHVREDGGWEWGKMPGRSSQPKWLDGLTAYQRASVRESFVAMFRDR